MAIAFESYATGTTVDDGVDPVRVTVTKPTGTTSGDVLVMVAIVGEDSGVTRTLNTITATGWTEIDRNSSVARHYAAFYKVAGGSEPSSYDFDFSFAAYGDFNAACIVSRFSGVDNTTPIDVSGLFDGEVTSTTVTFGGVTTTTANTMLVMCGGNARALTYTFNNGTKIIEIGATGSGGVAQAINASMGYLAQASAGASGDKTATLSGGTGRQNDGLIVALKEAAPSGLTITSVTPSSFDSGIAGIVIAGAGFGASQGSSTVDIGGQAQTVTAWSDTSITITSARGSNSMGAGQLKVTIR